MLSGGSIRLNRYYLRKDRIQQRHALRRDRDAVAVAGDEAKARDLVHRSEIQHFIWRDTRAR